MARAIRTRGVIEPVFVEALEELPAALGELLQDGDLLLTMGAGDIGAYASNLVDELSNGPSLQVHS
jgi:UDP-N-acetylmuramate--alanine ligase